MTSELVGQERYELRRLLARHLVGSGLELGPGHVPYPLPECGVSVRYVDRWIPAENQSLFPELGQKAEFPQPDIVADLDQDRLSMVPDDTEDFVIASHVLEHLANPLAMLMDIHRVLKDSGVAIIVLPDRTRTFDHRRDPTPLDHLVREYSDDVREVDDNHVAEFLTGTGTSVEGLDAHERQTQFELHRRRSIHVHCWSQEEFLPVLLYSITELGSKWHLVDGFSTDVMQDGFEFGYVVTKDPRTMSAHVRAARFQENWHALSQETGARGPWRRYRTGPVDALPTPVSAAVPVRMSVRAVIAIDEALRASGFHSILRKARLAQLRIRARMRNILR